MSIKSSLQSRPKWQQSAAGLAALTAVLSFVGVGVSKIYAHFEKASYAQDQRAAIAETHSRDIVSQEQAYKNDRVDRHKREIARLEYDLLDEDLPEPKRQWIVRRIRELQDTIACIQEEKC